MKVSAYCGRKSRLLLLLLLLELGYGVMKIETIGVQFLMLCSWTWMVTASV